MVKLEVGRNKHGNGKPQEVVPPRQKLTDFFDLDEDRPGQRHSKWFGSFDDSTYPWINHKLYGWMVCLAPATGGFWFWSKELGYFWTAYWEFPRIFLDRINNWTTLQAKSAPAAGR